MEIDYGPFRRQVALGADVDVAHAHAAYERGILTIVLPIAQRPPARERVVIEVRRA
jgi:HSP20 family molecular chaperone IbpA